MSYLLIRETVQPIDVGGFAAWAVKLTVTSTDAVKYPPKALVFQAENPADPETRGWFTAVATPSQLLEYPEDTPANVVGQVQQPYYRKDWVQLVGRNPSDIEDLVRAVYEELDFLKRNQDALERMAPAEILLAPYRPASGALWEGTTLGPYPLAEGETIDPALRVTVTFRLRSAPYTVGAVLTSDDADQVVLDNPATWLFILPVQELELTPAIWDWEAEVEVSSTTAFTAYSGSIQITP